MRTLDILAQANQAPLAKIDFVAISTEIGRALNIVLFFSIMTIVTTGLLDAKTAYWLLLIGGGATFSGAFIFPMMERRGLHLLRFKNEAPGLASFAVGYILGFAMMKTVGTVIYHGDSLWTLIPLMFVPAMLSMFANSADRLGLLAKK